MRRRFHAIRVRLSMTERDQLVAAQNTEYIRHYQGARGWSLRQVSRAGYVIAGLVAILALAETGRATGKPAPEAPIEVAPRADKSACPDLLKNRVVLEAVDNVSRRLEMQDPPLTPSQTMTLVRRELAASLRLDLPARDLPTAERLLRSLDTMLITRCWPQLAGLVARADSPAPGEGSATESATSGSIDNAYEAGRRRQAERNRQNDEDARRNAAMLQSHADAIEAAVEARAEEARRSAAELERQERAERDRQAERAQVARDEADRERQAEFKAERERTAAAIAAEERKRHILQEQAEVHRQQQAELLRQQQKTLAKVQAAAQDREQQEEQSHKLAAEIDQANAEREAAAQAAERLKKPECREADRVVAEEPKLQGPNALVVVLVIAEQLRAGMHAEACFAARRTFTLAERLRSVAARCDPAEAIPYNDLAAGLRGLILEQGC